MNPKVLAPVTNDDGLHHPPPGAQPSSRAGRVGPIDPAPCTPGGRSPDGAGSSGPTPGRGVTLATAAAILREHWEPEMRAHLLAVIRNLLELGGWDSRRVEMFCARLQSAPTAFLIEQADVLQALRWRALAQVLIDDPVPARG